MRLEGEEGSVCDSGQYSCVCVCVSVCMCVYV